MKLVSSLALLVLVIPQSAHRLERLAPAALMAEGRVIESVSSNLVIENRQASMSGQQILDVERVSLDLEDAQGYVYFLESDEELPLGKGLDRLRAGAWVELAPMPGREFSSWHVGGQPRSNDSPQPGSPGALMRTRPEVKHLAIDGWLYVWVIAEPRNQH